MKGKPAFRGSRGRGDETDPEGIAVAVFDRIVAEPERLGRFLVLTGLGPDTVRRAAAEPGFLAAVLDHVCADEGLLVAIAGEIGRDPAEVASARARLSPEASDDP